MTGLSTVITESQLRPVTGLLTGGSFNTCPPTATVVTEAHISGVSRSVPGEGERSVNRLATGGRTRSQHTGRNTSQRSDRTHWRFRLPQNSRPGDGHALWFRGRVRREPRFLGPSHGVLRRSFLGVLGSCLEGHYCDGTGRSAISACSGVTTSMMTPPFCISAKPRFINSVPRRRSSSSGCSLTREPKQSPS